MATQSATRRVRLPLWAASSLEPVLVARPFRATRTQALYPTAFDAGYARTMPMRSLPAFRRTRSGLCGWPHRVVWR